MILSKEERETLAYRPEPNFHELKLEGKKNYACSIYLTGGKRYGHFPIKKSIEHLRKWSESLLNVGLKGIMFHNCFTESELAVLKDLPVTFVCVNMPRFYMSGLYRFQLYDILIKKYKENISGIFFTDSTDLDFLKNPFKEKEYEESKIYIGHEPVIASNKWMLTACNGINRYLTLIKEDLNFANRPLLNAGLVGGSLLSVAPFIQRMSEECQKVYGIGYVQDMPLINYIAYTEFKDKVVFNRTVNTIFTGYEKDNTTAWIRHK